LTQEAIRLLLVEDNIQAARAVQLALLEHGFEVQVIHCGREVPGALAHHQSQVLVLDLTLPDIDGVVVAELVRRDWPHVPLILTTGHQRSALIEPLLRNAQTAFLQKPYEISELVRLIQARLKRPSPSVIRNS
jgi:DNA-binding response OmpR family regulator